MLLHRALVIGGIAIIAIGKIFLAGGILSEIGFRQCQALDASLIMNPDGINAASCFENSLPYFVTAGILLGIGAFTLVYGLRWKKTVTTNA